MSQPQGRTEAVRAYYEANPLMVSSPFGGVEGIDRALVDQVFETLSIEVGGRSILDVGCGRGYIGEVVVERGGAYAGVDLNVPEDAPPLSPRGRGERRRIVGDGARLPFCDGSFDGVFCIDVFEHFADGARAAAEFRRVLRTGGFVFLSAPNYANVAGAVKWLCETFGRCEKNTWAPFRNWQAQAFEAPLTGRTVRGVFAQAGFTRMRRMPHAAEAGLGLFPWVEHARMPEAIKFRLQRLFKRMGPVVVRFWPGASLHSFWKIEA